MIRKSWAVAVIAAMLVLAAGCGKSAPEPEKTPVSAPAAGGNTSPTTPANSTGKNTPTAPATGTTPKKDEKPVVFEKVNLGPLKMAETAKIGPLSVTVKEMAVVQKANGLPPNYNFVVLNLTIANEGQDVYTINSTDHFKMETPEAKTMPVNVSATAQKSPRLQGTIQGGQSASGWLGYLVKAQDGMFKYRFIHPDWGEARWEFAIR